MMNYRETPINQSSKDYFRKLTLIFFGLLLGQVFFLGVIHYLISNEPSESDDVVMILKIVVPIVMVGGYLVSTMIPRKRLKTLQEKENIKEKFKDYPSILIIKWAFLEGPTLLAIIAYFLSSDLYFAGLAILMILVFSTKKPTKSSVANDLNLNLQEQRNIEDDDFIVT